MSQLHFFYSSQTGVIVASKGSFLLNLEGGVLRLKLGHDELKEVILAYPEEGEDLQGLLAAVFKVVRESYEVNIDEVRARLRGE